MDFLGDDWFLRKVRRVEPSPDEMRAPGRFNSIQSTVVCACEAAIGA
jgi:hypothetical protein